MITALRWIKSWLWRITAKPYPPKGWDGKSCIIIEPGRYWLKINNNVIHAPTIEEEQGDGRD